ncbi:MAG: leucine-rich repeat domain-containing protein, partial [Anaeroplasmataceae bacterium]|nr:leucine-rich repeat domain-containing protein [Anaeroplasmataceae bacterium]
MIKKILFTLLCCSACIFLFTSCGETKRNYQECEHISNEIWSYRDDVHWQECVRCRKKINEGLHDFSESEYYCLICDMTTDSIILPMYKLSEDGLYYYVNGIRDCTVGNSGSPQITDMKIISMHNGLPVKTVALDSSKITNLVIENGVLEIAGINCNSLKSITIPLSIKTIYDSAFNGCKNLESVYYEGTIEDWCNISFAPSSVFYSDEEKTNPMYYAKHFYIKNSTNEWEELTSIEAPNNIKKIQEHIFNGFNSVTSISIPNSVTSIDLYSFRGCDNLISITLPLVVDPYYTRFNFGMLFENSVPKSLKEVKINGGNSIVDNTFSDCSSLTSVEIANSIKSIGLSAFSNCSGLTSITIPESVTSIGNNAFSRCNNLIDLRIPSSLTSIGEDFIYGCDSLKYNEYDNGLYLGNDDNPYLLFVKTKNTLVNSVTIHSNAKFIYQSAFSGCSNLTSITIPKNVTSIGSSAFSGCNRLSNVNYEGT